MHIEKACFWLCIQICWGLVPGFVSRVLGIVSWVLGIVFWVSGFVFWVLGFVTKAYDPSGKPHSVNQDEPEHSLNE